MRRLLNSYSLSLQRTFASFSRRITSWGPCTDQMPRGTIDVTWHYQKVVVVNLESKTILMSLLAWRIENHVRFTRITKSVLFKLLFSAFPPYRCTQADPSGPLHMLYQRSLTMKLNSLLLLLSLFSWALGQRCDNQNGEWADYKYKPCGSANTTFSTCCLPGDPCLPNGLCEWTGHFRYQGACSSDDMSECQFVCDLS